MSKIHHPFNLTRRSLLKKAAALGCALSIPAPFKALAGESAAGGSPQNRGGSIPLNVFNPTGFRRKQWVLFGSEQPYGTPVVKLPHSYLNVAQVDVPRSFEGQVATLLDSTEPFAYHPLLTEDLFNGFQLAISEGRKHYAFPPVKSVWEHPRVISATSYVRTANGHAHLYLYVFHNTPVMHYELVYHCENRLVYPTNPNPLAFNWFGDAKEVLHKCFNGNPKDLLKGQIIDDTQGRRWQGAFFFYNSKAGMTAELLDTMQAMYAFPLHAMANWNKWGAFSSSLAPVNYSYIKTLNSKQGWLDYTDPFAHFGLIGAVASGTTGAQGGWGAWQNWWAVCSGSAATMHYDQMATAQDHCRPNSYFESDGSMVVSANHPQWVTWDQRTHYNSGVSPDRLGRDKQTGGTTTPWWGYDYQHDSSTLMANDFILNGSLASRDYLLRKIEAYMAGWTLPSVWPNHSTNGFPIGRAARSLLAAVYCYRATGETKIIKRIADMVDEELIQSWVGSNVPGPIKAGRIWGPTSGTSGLPNTASWTVWEDALWVMGAEAAQIALRENGYISQADLLAYAVYAIGKSVTLYGWMPNELEMALAVAWDGTGNPPANYLDPSQVKPAYGTDYKIWAIPCLYITRRYALSEDDSTTVSTATALITQLLVNLPLQHYEHLGAA